MGRLWRPSPGIRGAIPRLDRASRARGLARLELSRCRLRHGPQQLLADELWRARGGRGRYRRAVAGECPRQFGGVPEHAGYARQRLRAAVREPLRPRLLDRGDPSPGEPAGCVAPDGAGGAAGRPGPDLGLWPRRQRMARLGARPAAQGAVSSSAGEPRAPLLALSRGSALDAVAMRAAAEQVLRVAGAASFPASAVNRV